MSAADSPTDSSRRWGDESALFDDDEARRRLLDATGRCIVRQGSIRIQMADVANEAGVSRSTVYRYFQTRNELILSLLLDRTDAALHRIVAVLPFPESAALTIPELILAPVRLVKGNPLNEALYTPTSRALIASSPALAPDRNEFVDVTFKHYGPMFEGWRSDGQIYADLDIRETIRWINAVSFLVLTPPWNEMTADDRGGFIDRYIVRALVA